MSLHSGWRPSSSLALAGWHARLVDVSRESMSLLSSLLQPLLILLPS